MSDTPSPTLVRFLVASLAVLGVLGRVAPLFDPLGRALTQFPSEDGYLMLTIARNIALGSGMSIADGTIATNGTQPLAAFVYATLFWLVGGDRVAGVVLVQVYAVGVAAAAAWVLWRVARELSTGHPRAEAVAQLTAATWFAGPLGMRHTQNGLETGTYTLVILAIAWFVSTRLRPVGEAWPLRRCFELGSLLGLAFWARNDAVLLVAAVCASRLLSATRSGFGVLGKRALEAVAVAAPPLVAALPWIVYNKLRFGYLMPISGVAEGSGVALGDSLKYIPAALAEYVLVALPIPGPLEQNPIVIATSIGICVAAIWICHRTGLAARQWYTIFTLWLAAMLVFYGIFFGVGFFSSRYFFPLSPYLAIISFAYGARVWERRMASHAWGPIVAAAVLLSLITGLDARLYRDGTDQGHFGKVRWIEANLPKDAWIGAIQTGTIGFFHDRTINLDGKVNPQALQARLAGRTHDYVVEHTEIEYLVDWPGLESWLEGPPLRGRFEIFALDRGARCVVLRRVPWSTPIAMGR